MSQNSVTSPDKSSDAHQISNGREESQKYKGVEKYVVVPLKYLMNDIYLIFLFENWLENTDLFFFFVNSDSRMYRSMLPLYGKMIMKHNPSEKVMFSMLPVYYNTIFNFFNSLLKVKKIKSIHYHGKKVEL